MSKLLSITVLTAAIAWSGTCLAEAGSPVQSPVQAPPKAPAPPAAARADSGYRTYSYEPGMTTRSYSRAGLRSPGYLDARTKALGRY